MGTHGLSGFVSRVHRPLYSPPTFDPMPTSQEIDSLIRLLEDPDPYVQEKIRDRFVEIGSDALPFLEIAQRGEDIAVRRAAGAVIRVIQPQELMAKFRTLCETKPGHDIDLEKGILLLMAFGHPSVNPEQITKELDDLAEGLRPLLRADATTKETVRTLSQYLFVDCGFDGDTEDYYQPDNSYLNKVLERKKGLPISLSVLAVLVSKRVGLPIVGVGLPCHFIAMHSDPINPVLFDPFHHGRILTRDQCIQLVKGFGLEFEERFLFPATGREILVRMIQNLIQVYKKADDEIRAQQLTDIRNILIPGSAKNKGNDE